MNNTLLGACSSLQLNWLFIFLTIFFTVIAAISAIGNTFICFILTKSHSLPSNVSLLLQNTAVAVTLVSVATVVRGICNFVIWFTGFIELSRLTCTIIEIPTQTMVFVFTLSVSAIGIDRLINTIRKDRFADSENPKRLAYAMLAAIWVIALLINCAMVTFDYLDPTSSHIMCYCSIAEASRTFAIAVCPGFILLEGVTIVCYLLVYNHSRSSYLSFTINTTQHCLANRYQMMSNIKTTALLLPTVIVHGITYVLLGAGVSSLAISTENKPESRFTINAVLVIVIVMALEGVTHPIWLLSRHEHMRKAAAKYIPPLRRYLDKRTAIAKPAKVPENRLEAPDHRSSVLNKARLAVSVIIGSNKVSSGVIDFRMKPDQNNHLLTAIWASKQENGR